MARVRVLLADDSDEFLQAASAFLARDPQVTVLGCAHDGREACRMVKTMNPDLVLMDLKMPVMDGIEAVSRMKEGRPAPRVMIVTLHDHPELRRAVKAAGADGFISKAEFADAVPAVVDAAAKSKGA